jgi:hypothetical protein
MVYPERFRRQTIDQSDAHGDPIMFYALNWFVVAAFLALWSIAAWALHAVAVWAVSSSGSLSDAASRVGTMSLPDWLAPWVPPEIAPWASELLAGLRPVIDSLLQAAPSLADGVTVATWVVWGCICSSRCGAVVVVAVLGPTRGLRWPLAERASALAAFNHHPLTHHHDLQRRPAWFCPPTRSPTWRV